MDKLNTDNGFQLIFCLFQKDFFRMTEFFIYFFLFRYSISIGPQAGRPAQTYIQQLCEDTGSCPEDLPEAMNDREKWRERVRDICATSTTWWWWWWWFLLVKSDEFDMLDGIIAFSWSTSNLLMKSDTPACDSLPPTIYLSQDLVCSKNELQSQPITFPCHHSEIYIYIYIYIYFSLSVSSSISPFLSFLSLLLMTPPSFDFIFDYLFLPMLNFKFSSSP